MTRIRRILSHIYHAIRHYWFDAYHYVHHSLMSGYNRSQEQFIGKITLYAHVVEKGLTMPQMRYNFGEANIRTLIQLLNEYIEYPYDTHDVLFISAISNVFEYESVHINNGIALPADIEESIAKLHAQFPTTPALHQLLVSKREMYHHGDFAYIATNRHSVRNFCGHVTSERLDDAIRLASTAPSACNRQPNHVHIIESTHPRFQQILEMQHGSRGFGHLADKLLIISTSLVAYNGILERNSAYIDGGIYLMNLLYALQYQGIAACTLNCSMSIDETKKLRKLLNTTDVFIAIVAIGDCPDEVLIARSTKK